MIKVSTTGMAVSLKTDLRFPISGQWGHGDRIIQESDNEMDERAVEAVKAAINKAKICKKPIAGYDNEKKQAYVEYANGERKYVNIENL